MYKVGTRVKKVRSRFNLNLGSTGVVIKYLDEPNIWGSNMLGKADSSFMGLEGKLWPAGTLSNVLDTEWEPIIPEGSNVPSEASIHELLDSKFYEKENCNV